MSFILFFLSFFFFTSESNAFVKSQDLFWVGMMGGKQTIIPEAFPILESICGKGGKKARSHFGLKDLGHALTDCLTSER